MGAITVLLVDDEPEFRALLRGTLDDDERFEVIDEASDGHQAVALVTFHQPDVVLLDLMMPELDGVAASAMIRKEAPDALIAMLSSLDARAAERAAVEAGAHLFIEKERLAEVPDLLADLVSAHADKR